MNKLERHRKKEAVVAQPEATTQQMSKVTGGGTERRIMTQKSLELGPLKMSSQGLLGVYLNHFNTIL